MLHSGSLPLYSPLGVSSSVHGGDGHNCPPQPCAQTVPSASAGAWGLDGCWWLGSCTSLGGGCLYFSPQVLLGAVSNTIMGVTFVSKSLEKWDTVVSLMNGAIPFHSFLPFHLCWRLQRLARDLLKQLQVQDSGSWANNKVSALDRTLGEIARILEKEVGTSLWPRPVSVGLSL